MAHHPSLVTDIVPGCRIEYFPAFIDRHEAERLFAAFLTLEPTSEVIRMFGVDIVTPRRTAQFGAEYAYNATAKSPQERTPLTAALRQRVETVAGRLDGALVQVYPDGRAGIGWHRDKGHPEVIASVSLGAEREFVFSSGPARGCREVHRMRLANGSLLLIPAATNEALKHRLPLATRAIGPRVNVTFRRFSDPSTQPWSGNP